MCMLQYVFFFAVNACNKKIVARLAMEMSSVEDDGVDTEATPTLESKHEMMDEAMAY